MSPNRPLLLPSSMRSAMHCPISACVTSTFRRHLKKSGEPCEATDMSAFEYAAPQSIEEAVAILSSGPEARPLAGGQTMLVGRNRERLKGTVLVDLGRISSLSGIGRQDGAVRIGATTTLNVI